MQLLQSWKESLFLLKPQNLKPFTLVTLKAIGQTFRYSWFLLIIPFFVFSFFFIFARLLMAFDSHVSSKALTWLINSLMTLTIYYPTFFIFSVSCMAARASMMKKTTTYFIHQPWIVLFVLYSMYSFIVHDVVLTHFSSLINLINKNMAISFYLLLRSDPFITEGSLYVFIAQIFLFPILFFSFFFALERCSLVRASILGVKLMWYTLPISLLFGMCTHIFYSLHLFHSIHFVGFFLFRTVAMFSTIIFFPIFMPISATIFANLFIKFVHEKPELYSCS